MEKKNTMLLTVIAVATLLVAVVGATFAYFSVQSSADSTGATVKGKASATGQITATTKLTNLNLALLGTDMDESKKGTTYYGTTANIVDGQAYNTTETSYDLAEFLIASGETNYTCTYKYNVSVDFGSFDSSAITDTQKNDIKVKFTGAGIADATEYTIGQLMAGAQTLTGSVDLVPTVAQQLKVSTSFANTEVLQNELAGISYTIKIDPAAADAFVCVVK